jgi:hypothetical protein
MYLFFIHFVCALARMSKGEGVGAIVYNLHRRQRFLVTIPFAGTIFTPRVQPSVEFTALVEFNPNLGSAHVTYGPL